MKDEPLKLFDDDDVGRLIRDFGKPLRPGFKETVLRKALAESIEREAKTPPTTEKPSAHKRGRGID